jgi:hypothetical protein
MSRIKYPCAEQTVPRPRKVDCRLLWYGLLERTKLTRIASNRFPAFRRVVSNTNDLINTDRPPPPVQILITSVNPLE